MEKQRLTRQDLVDLIMEAENALNITLKPHTVLSLYNACFGSVSMQGESKNACMRGVFADLEASNVKFLSGEPITADRACAHCNGKDCESSETLELTDEEKLSCKSFAQIRKDRKELKSKLEKVWERREKKAKESGY